MQILNANLSFVGPHTRRSKTTVFVVHHSGETVLQNVNIIHECHLNEKKWNGIGYNFYVRKNAEVWEGRPDWAVGAHAGTSINPTSIGICFEGDFEVEQMGDAQFNAGVELIKYLNVKYGNLPIEPHVKYMDTDCPGKNFPLQELRNGNIRKGIVQAVIFEPNAIVDVTKAVPAQSSANTYDTETATNSTGYVDGNAVKEKVQILSEGTVKNAEGYARYFIRYKVADGFKERWINSKWIVKDASAVVVTPPAPPIIVQPPQPTIDYKALYEQALDDFDACNAQLNVANDKATFLEKQKTELSNKLVEARSAFNTLANL